MFQKYIWWIVCHYTTFTPMKDLTTAKITRESLKNFRIATAHSNGKKQYEIIEEASKDILKKISSKIKQSPK